MCVVYMYTCVSMRMCIPIYIMYSKYKAYRSAWRSTDQETVLKCFIRS